MTVYVQRDAGSNIIGVFRNPQDYAQEALDDSDPAVVAYLAASSAPPQQRAALNQAVAGMLSDINTYLAIADTATPAQVRTAVKGLATDVKLIIQYLALQVN